MAPKRNDRCKFCRNLYQRNFKNVRKINKLCDCAHPTYSRKDRIHRVRTRNRKLNIPKLVYKFLGNVASLETGNNEEKPTRPRSNRSGNKNPKKQQRNPDPAHVSTKNVDESRTSVSTSRTAETNSTICTAPGSANSGIKTKQKFSIQAIKDYIKAGIAEGTKKRLKKNLKRNVKLSGKRRAKRYMCKALSFGVDTGYLIPTDSDGQVLRVSSALISFTAQKDDPKDDERGRGIRQKLRRGNATCTSEERKVLRRRGGPLPQKRPRSPSSTPSSTSSTKRASRPKTKKPKYGKRIKKHKKRGSKRVKLKRGSGRPRGRMSSAKLKLEKSCHGVKREKGEEKGIREKENLGEETLTPSRSEEDNAKSIKKENLSDPSIEENGSEKTEAKKK